MKIFFSIFGRNQKKYYDFILPRTRSSQLIKKFVHLNQRVVKSIYL